jgi:mannose-1-phosphate guanylyltransferase
LRSTLSPHPPDGGVREVPSRRSWPQPLAADRGFRLEPEREERQQAAARVQSLMRVVNEQLARLVRAQTARASLFHDFICECARRECDERITLTLSEYEAVRIIPTRFVVLPDHVLTDVEEVVGRVRGLAVVEKHGVGARLAAAFDPRRRPVDP